MSEKTKTVREHQRELLEPIISDLQKIVDAIRELMEDIDFVEIVKTIEEG